jgi:elongation factor P hydroxylase
MTLDSEALEGVFRECFLVDYETILVGGGEEPVYLPSDDPKDHPHRVVYREDFVASALHEVAHWCLAGPRRRSLEDYGYWYSPDGRTIEEQSDFENVEARPQALEQLFSEVCDHSFHLSADNLSLGVDSSGAFARAVDVERKKLLADGLPLRAETFRRTLRGRTRS